MACESLASARSTTSVVPLVRLTDPPFVTSAPFTAKTASVASSFWSTFKVATKVLWVVPLAAVTVTLKLFGPVTSPFAPATTTVALKSFACASYTTSLVPYGKSIKSPVDFSTPLILKTLREASSFCRTFKMTV